MLDRAGQFSLVLPPKDYRETGVVVHAPATVTSAGELICDTPRVTTAGNTTYGAPCA